MVIPPPQPVATPGSFGRRLLAWFLDLILIAIFVFVVAVIIGAFAAAANSSHEVPERVANAAVLVAGIVVPVAYLVGSWRGGATLGMTMLHLRVVPRFDTGYISWAQAFLRLIGSLPSMVFLVPFGLLAVLIRPDRRALHDLLARTRVVYVRYKWLGPGAENVAPGYDGGYGGIGLQLWPGAGAWPPAPPPPPPPHLPMGFRDSDAVEQIKPAAGDVPRESSRLMSLLVSRSIRRARRELLPWLSRSRRRVTWGYPKG